MTGPRVVCAGLLTVDLIHEVDRVPARNEKITGRAQRLEIGGPATNAARAAAALGAHVVLVAPFGESPLTDFARESLAHDGVDWFDPAATQPNPSPLSTVVVESSGERSVISGGGMPIPPDWLRGNMLDGAAALLIDGHGGDLPAVMARARGARGIRVLLDGGSHKAGMSDYLAHIDLALLSADFTAPDGSEPLAWALRHGARAAARSAGAEPITLRHNDGRTERIPVPTPTAIVDTNGAGDVLHGGALVGLGLVGLAGKGAAYEEILRFAARLAGLSVAYPGVLGWVGHVPVPRWRQ